MTGMEPGFWATAPLYAAGVLYAGIAILHLAFWKLFRWRQELAKLGRTNRAAMQILNLCMTLVFVIAAYLCFAHSEALAASPLGHALLIGLAIFWITRGIEQIVFFGWRRARSLGLTGLFAVLAALHLAPLA
jgi:uncharacterized membrane protein YhaH (DUF805 family)